MVLLRLVKPAARQVLLLLGMCALTACTRTSAPPPNVVVIVVDTLRADRLGVLGNTRGLTPFLDGLAERALVFHSAYAAASWTQPSVASLFTSRFQSQHGIVSPGSKLDPSEVTLAEVLAERGYQTAAFSANGLIASVHGYSQGFETYKALWGKPSPSDPAKREKYRAEDLNAMAGTWLDQLPTSATRPFFLYLQYLEPHAPYEAPENMLKRTFGDRTHPDLRQITGNMMFGNLKAPDAAALRDITDAYDAEVASVDAGIEQLYGILAQRGLLENTILIITADHGEGLLEHGLVSHGATLYEEVIHVPLLVIPAGGIARLDVRDPVSLLDVAPTVLDLVGASVPPSFEGRSLGPVVWRARHPWMAQLRGRWEHGNKARMVFSEHIVPPEEEGQRIKPHERAVIANGAKLIAGVGGERESYDLAVDPAEHTPLAEPDAGRLDKVLAAFRDAMGTRTHSAPEVDAELRSHLRALGYLN